MPKHVCLVCSQKSWNRLYPVKDFNQDLPGSWEIFGCTNCRLGVLVPLPESEHISAFYDTSFYTSGKKRFSNIVEHIREILANNRYKSIKEFIPKSGKILDFGSGAGHFGNVLKRNRWDVYNEDFAYSGENSKLTMEDDKPVLDYPDEFFDAVSMWYVIEHMLNPRKTIKELYRVLKRDGVLITAQQNFVSKQAKAFKENWLILDPPRHIYQFSPKNLRELAYQEGLILLKEMHNSIEFGPFTLLQSFLNSVLGNRNYLFKLLKNRELKTYKSKRELRIEKNMGLLSLLIGAGLGPFALLAYYILLQSDSGDVFTSIFTKQK